MKIAILGFGVEGQDAARYFLGKGHELTVFDRKPKRQLNREFRIENIEWRTGPKYLEGGLRGFDLIVRSPGFYRFHPVLLKAEKDGAKISSTTKIFFEECKIPIIGVTGTKGKGTTARMLNLALESSGFKTILAGNIGEPMLSLLPRAAHADWVVLELSSFQTIDLEKSPRIVVVTNIKVDHLDWHKDEEEYVKAKENLWRHQTPEDFAVFNFDDSKSLQLSRSSVGQEFYFSIEGAVENGAWADPQGKVHLVLGEAREIGDTRRLSVPGKHNWQNALGALLGAVLAGAQEDRAWRGIKTYKGAEHRLEKVAEKNGAVWVNDSAATTPEATIAAVEAYREPKILILGGSRKGREFRELAQVVVQNNVKAVILIGRTGPEIKKSLLQEGYDGILKNVRGGIDQIVSAAKRLSKHGDVVLFSPACASFDMFANYGDRGKKFKQAALA